MRFYFAALLFCLLPACRGCAVRDQYELALDEQRLKWVKMADMKRKEDERAAAQAQIEAAESASKMREAMEPRFVDRSDYRACPDDVCKPTTEEWPEGVRIHSTAGPSGKRLIIPPDVLNELRIPPGALDHVVDITVIVFKSRDPDHSLDYAVLPLGIELKKPAKLILAAPRDGPAKHRLMPLGHGKYLDASSLYEPFSHRETITLNRL